MNEWMNGVCWCPMGIRWPCNCNIPGWSWDLCLRPFRPHIVSALFFPTDPHLNSNTQINYMGIIETWFCSARDVTSRAWFVRLYYTQIRLVIRLLLFQIAPQIPATHHLTLPLVLNLIFPLTGVTILVVSAFRPLDQLRPTKSAVCLASKRTSEHKEMRHKAQSTRHRAQGTRWGGAASGAWKCSNQVD